MQPESDVNRTSISMQIVCYDIWTKIKLLFASANFILGYSHANIGAQKLSEYLAKNSSVLPVFAMYCRSSIAVVVYLTYTLWL